jgi:NhaA family Na+:H+ antiporter
MGLLIGKPIGIFTACFVAVKLRITELPLHSSWSSISGVSILCGVGFTMSLFISSLAFQSSNEESQALLRLSVLGSSLIAGFGGYVVLRFCSRSTRRHRGDRA